MIAIHLLLVDDERSFVEIMARRLTARGFSVEQTFSGQEALDRLETDDAVDVVVLDVKMPGMDGMEAIKMMRKRHPLVEVIMLTGHATVSTAVDAMKLGASDYLMKPYDLEELVGKITLAAERKRHREAGLHEIRTKPYLTRAEKDERVDELLASPFPPPAKR